MTILHSLADEGQARSNEAKHRSKPLDDDGQLVISRCTRAETLGATEDGNSDIILVIVRINVKAMNGKNSNLLCIPE